ncbi:PDZ/DHR/GLGF domain-containing protein [Calothrix parasitica NIES-267]|uniref:PDZ/DHR/GLGF domain-containing protein n=1 Tax=Calothrix parasitica NIES-267 TaxID=1973488 RepID=A0A1Z4LMA1_9CYAN|nr:PDZ/DHR/GLGF domain-containing protein [Calothrix parasitica NIES-267]
MLYVRAKSQNTDIRYLERNLKYMKSISSLQALSNNIAEIVEKSGKAIVSLNANRRFTPSGIHWQEGIIVTSDESLKRYEDITVTLENGDRKSVSLLGRDPSTDVAFFQIENPEIPVATIGDAANLKVGNLVLALARSSEGDIRAAMGAISVVSGEWKSMSGGNIDKFIRPDISLYPGFSGGALVDALGNIIGMNTTGRRGTALTIPASTINRVIEQLVSKGRISRGYLGLGMQPVRLPDNLKSSLNLTSNSGVIVVNVESNSAAENAGILLGDVLISFDGSTVGDTNDVLGLLNDSSSVGKSVQLQIVRGGELIELNLTVSERII